MNSPPDLRNEAPPNDSEIAEGNLKGDCYSDGERGWMEYGQLLRARWLGPLLNAMNSLHMTPDHLSIISLFFGVAFLPAWLLGRPWSAVTLLWIHVALDGLDGPLARHQNAASPRGSFTDSFCDQIVVTAMTIGLMMKRPGVSIAAGATFSVLYVGVLAISMVRNSLKIPYSWLLRPRLIIYAIIPLQLMTSRHMLEPVFWISNTILGWKLLTGFWNLRKKLRGPTDR